MTGKIALVRYGGNFRGLKVKAAQDAGAVGEYIQSSAFFFNFKLTIFAGCIIYSDPAEDGDSEY